MTRYIVKNVRKWQLVCGFTSDTHSIKMLNPLDFTCLSTCSGIAYILLFLFFLTDIKFLSFFIFLNFILFYNTVLVLPYIDMNQPQVYMSFQS